jgi:prophage regulatory protein
MMAGDIARRLGVSRNRAQQLMARSSFPDPFDELPVGRIWLAADVEAWIAEHRPVIAEDPETHDGG